MKSFRDPATNVLKAYGFVGANGTDASREEDESFSLEPGKWKFADGVWVPYVDTKREIQVQIDQLERESMMNRGSRELAMRQIEERALLDATQTITAEQILAAQPFYVRLKALDQYVSSLRIQL